MATQNEQQRKLRVLDLFSGIGGFSLGLERTGGFETVAFCEIDPYCRRVLRKHWPNVPIYGDVRNLTAAGFDDHADVICGGYPCQGESVAGKRLGAADDRWLWPPYFRLIQELWPTWVLGENVAGHITLGLDVVLSDLEAIGYSWRPFVIPACAVDAKHRRDRTWIVAHSNRAGFKVRAHPEGGHLQGLHGEAPQTVSKRSHGNARPIEDGAYGAMADTDNAKTTRLGEHGREVHGLAEPIRPVSSGSSGWWATEPGVGRVANGVSNRVDRLRALGNAVVPQIPEIIGRAILEAEGSG